MIIQLGLHQWVQLLQQKRDYQLIINAHDLSHQQDVDKLERVLHHANVELAE